MDSFAELTRTDYAVHAINGGRLEPANPARWPSAGRSMSGRLRDAHLTTEAMSLVSSAAERYARLRMDAQRLQGMVFLLSAAGLAMPGCDSDEETPDGEEAPSGSVCERHAANYVECYADGLSLEDAIENCEERIEYLADISQECSDTYVVLADCLSKLECSELNRGCVEETTAHGSLVCMSGFSTGE